LVARPDVEVSGMDWDASAPKPASLGRGPVKHRLRKKKPKRPPPPVPVPIVTFRTSAEIKLLIVEGAKLQRRSVTKFLEQLVVDWHRGQR
jgi:hypothetical protein